MDNKLIWLSWLERAAVNRKGIGSTPIISVLLGIAQLVEQWTVVPWVTGSIPVSEMY
jgi:hypothetical protein